MKLALIGKSISHSASPALYKRLISSDLAYHLLDVDEVSQLPTLAELAACYDGINITSPYKTHYAHRVTIEDEVVKEIGAINTIGFCDGKAFGTNTDLLAVRNILNLFRVRYPGLHIILLGAGVMARVTKFVADELGLDMTQLSRKNYPQLSYLNLSPFEKNGAQNLVINACSRDFCFTGHQSRENIFWDYNYHFLPHQNTLPFKVKEYHDGQEMLLKQAEFAIQFWQSTNPKLKC